MAVAEQRTSKTTETAPNVHPSRKGRNKREEKRGVEIF